MSKYGLVRVPGDIQFILVEDSRSVYRPIIDRQLKGFRSLDDLNDYLTHKISCADAMCWYRVYRLGEELRIKTRRRPLPVKYVNEYIVIDKPDQRE